jgi:hypothetical protein
MPLHEDSELTPPKTSQLYDMLKEGFNEDELKDLCFRLKNKYGLKDIDYENLRGEVKAAKVLELVQYCERHGYLKYLDCMIRQLRPDPPPPKTDNTSSPRWKNLPHIPGLHPSCLILIVVIAIVALLLWISGVQVLVFLLAIIAFIAVIAIIVAVVPLLFGVANTVASSATTKPGCTITVAVVAYGIYIFLGETIYEFGTLVFSRLKQTLVDVWPW